MSKRTRRDELLAEMQSVRTVDCHSHTMLRRDYYKVPEWNLFNLMAYFGRDINSVTGKTGPELFDAASNDAQRWEILKGILQQARNVSYWRHNIVVYQNLFGLRGDDLTDRNWRGVNERIKKKTKDPRWYDHVTNDKCRLQTAVRNVPWSEDWEPEYFTCVLRMESALNLHEADTRHALEQLTGTRITGLKRLKTALVALTEAYNARGNVGIKLAHAYSRTLHSEPVSDAVAARHLSRALSGKELNPTQVKQLQDHIIFFLADMAGQMGLVFQIHTGVQGNYSRIPESDPLLLIPLLLAFPNTRFDLFHAGYPYSREIGMLGKHHPNVWLNMCWMYVITMAGSRNSLSEWIDLVPGHRLLGFGSDVGSPDFVYGHLLMARSCLADVLAEKVQRDFLSPRAALDLARMMLYDNPCALYGLDRPDATRS